MIDDTYPPLAAWLHGERVAQLTYDGLRGVQLRYTASAVERYGINGLALSASLPVRVEAYLPDRSAPYLDRLLPEGNARSLLERHFRVPRGDTFHLLEALAATFRLLRPSPTSSAIGLRCSNRRSVLRPDWTLDRGATRVAFRVVVDDRTPIARSRGRWHACSASRFRRAPGVRLRRRAAPCPRWQRQSGRRHRRRSA